MLPGASSQGEERNTRERFAIRSSEKKAFLKMIKIGIGGNNGSLEITGLVYIHFRDFTHWYIFGINTSEARRDNGIPYTDVRIRRYIGELKRI
jgi:hypothetical protein